MTDELKPCPFCGKHPMGRWESFPVVFSLPWIWRRQVSCSSCGATGPLRVTKQRAVWFWNERHSGDQQP